MKKIIPFFFLLFTIIACDFESSDSNNQSDVTEKPVDTVQENWICIPNKQVGLIKANFNEADIIKAYGQENVRQEEVGIGEGEMAMASIVFPGTQNELIVEWQDGFTFQRISRIRIHQDSAQWVSEEGIKIGSTLEELININGKDFNFYGFEWDQSGAVYDWDDGKVNAQLVVFLRPDNPEPVYPDLLGDETFSSSHQKAQAAKLVVESIIIHFGL